MPRMTPERLGDIRWALEITRPEGKSISHELLAELDAVRAERDELAERLGRCEVALQEAKRKADDHRRQRDEARMSRITDEELEMIGRAMPGTEGEGP